MNTFRVTFCAFTKRDLLKSSLKFLSSSRSLSNISNEKFAAPASSYVFSQKFLLNSYTVQQQRRRQRFPVFEASCCHFSTKNTGESEPEKKPSLYQRFKLMYKEYWYVLLPVHIVTSACWLGGFYYLAVTGVDICKLLEMLGAPDSWVLTMRNSKAGGIVTAYTMYKIATPARYTVTLGGTTVSINYLKKWGWIKPMPSKEQLKVIYEGKKTALKEKVSATTGEIKDEFAKTRDEITQHMKEARTGFKQSSIESREGFKQGIREAADEWCHMGKLVKRNVKEYIQKKNKDSK